jgi:hypothetical protein
MLGSDDTRNLRIWWEATMNGTFEYFIICGTGFHMISDTGQLTSTLYSIRSNGIIENIDFESLTAVVRYNVTSMGLPIVAWTILNLLTGDTAATPIETVPRHTTVPGRPYKESWFPGERFVTKGFYYSPRMVKPINHMTPFGTPTSTPNFGLPYVSDASFRQFYSQIPDMNGFGYWEVFSRAVQNPLDPDGADDPGWCAGPWSVTWCPYV